MTLLALWRTDNKGSNIELSKPARRLVQWSRQDRVVARASVVVIKVVGFMLYFEGRANILADRLEIICGTKISQGECQDGLFWPEH